MRTLLLALVISFGLGFATTSRAKEIEAIGPLLVTDPRSPGWESHGAWGELSQQLREAKRLGVTAISVDIWWGLVQARGPEEFDWAYYDRLLQEIVNAGLKIVPILSIHQCGGNVGDDVTIKLPEWFIKKFRSQGFAYVSEAGNVSEEFPALFASGELLDDFRRFWKAFRDRYARLAPQMARVDVGLGPAGELIYPAYYSHDRNAGDLTAGFPNRGSLQASSDLAQARLRDWLRQRYGNNIDALNSAWGHPGRYKSFDEIRVLTTRKEVDEFFTSSGQYGPMGKDFFEWYHSALMDHGHRMLTAAAEVFNEKGAEFKDIPLGFKIPGVHWHFHNRLAQVTAGLVHTRKATDDPAVPWHQRWPSDWVPQEGHGYTSLFEKLVERLKRDKPNVKWVGTFTCGEMPNGGADAGNSGAHDLVRAIGMLAE